MVNDGWWRMDGGGLRIFPSPEVTHRPRTTVTDCRLRNGQLSRKERLMIDGGGLMMDDVRGICFVLPSRQSLGVGTLIPRDFIPGYLRSARGVFQTLLSNSGGSLQHRDAEESESLLSGALCASCGYTPGLLPRTPTLR